MFKYLNRGISMPIAIGTITALVIVIGGGALAYQYYAQKTEIKNPVVDFSKLDKDDLLHKLFPSLTFKDGVADHTPEHYDFLNLYLQNSIEDYFINIQEKNLLFVVKLDGVAHAGGLYHAYLGLFNENGKLLTPASSYPSGFDFYNDKAQFGGDEGEFRFYNCKGVKYIAFASAGCPNGGCCSGGVNLFRINNGEFEKIQTIDSNSLAKNTPDLRSIIFSSVDAAVNPPGTFGLKIILSDEKIIVKKVPTTMGNSELDGYFGCPETDYKVLNWNKNNCRFE